MIYDADKSVECILLQKVSLPERDQVKKIVGIYV